MKRRYLPLSVTLLLVLASFSAQALTTLYISPAGKDAWSGQVPLPNAEGTDGPLATLVGARTKVREIKASDGLRDGGIRVELAPGVYRLTEPFTLEAEDSGTPENPVVYAASTKGQAVFSGGVAVDTFSPVTDAAVLDRLDAAARANVVQADLKALGITDFGSPAGGGMELYFRGKPMTLARWPNEGFATIQSIVVDDGHQIHGIKGSKTGLFTYEGDRPARWVGEKDGWLHGYWFWDWSDERQKIAEIDVEKSQIRLEEPYHTYGYRPKQWYYAYNMLSEIDQPGEWYVDREAGILYFWPPEATQPGDISVSIVSNLVAVKNAAHITLHGLVFELSRGCMLQVEGGAGVRVAACTFRSGGGDAVSVSGERAHIVFGCDIYQMGGGGISLSGGNRETLTPAGHTAENNHIYDYGRWYRMYRSGISVHGVGNRVAHNHIHNAPHMGIGFGGNDHIIEFNELHHVCLESNDAGAMYCGRNWTMRGNVVRHNYLHEILGFREKGCVGVYLDDMFSSADIIGNVFYKVTRAAFIGGGRDCSVVNNIFVDCNPALHVDARALGWAHYHADMWIEEGNTKGTLSDIRYKEPPYSERYPKLVGILEDEPKAPKGNLIARNICVGGRWDGMEPLAKEYLTLENNLVEEDPHFVDQARRDFRLKDDSPAFDMGFESIPMDRIGLYEHPDRAR